jgi:hypothetical protein
LHQIAYKLTATVFVLVGSLFVIPVFAQGNTTTNELGVPENCAEVPTPMGPEIPGRFGETPGNLAFVYERGGGLAPALSFERISYDSLTKQLVTISPSGPPEVQILGNHHQRCLEDVINASGFFEVQSEYPGQGADVFTYSLGIMLNNRTNGVSWTDLSEGVPPGIFEIVEQIGNLAAR